MGHTSVLDQRLDQLEQEREELEAMLEERDGQLGAMRDSVAALNAEYLADLESVRAECRELAQIVEQSAEEYSRLDCWWWICRGLIKGVVRTECSSKAQP